MWVLLAFGSAFFAGLTAVLAKVGIKNIDTDVATAVRTVVVLLMSWLMAWLTGTLSGLGSVSARTWVFLILSGLATGASWLCYFRALQLGDVNKVTPVDKSSTVMTMALAYILLGESLTALKLLCMALIGVGAYLMIQRRPAQAAAPGTDVSAQRGSAAARASGQASPAPRDVNRAWLPFALGSAVFASLTAILGKIGIEGVDSTLGTAIRTCVVLVMAWAIVYGRGKAAEVRAIRRVSFVFLILSGLATGASWLCFYGALRAGPASVVVPIDKLSILVSIAFARVVFGEKLTLKAAIGLALLVAGTLLLLL